jgi:hypothetical protein
MKKIQKDLPTKDHAESLISPLADIKFLTNIDQEIF